VPKKINEKPEQDGLAEAKQQILDLEREIQSLQLELEEKERMLAVAQHDLTVQTKNAKDLTGHSVHSRLEQLFADMGGPLVQIVTQDHLSNVQGKTLQAKDLHAVTNRLIDCLRSHGLEVIGTIGESATFDSKFHELLSFDEMVAEGERVTVRMVGLSFGGKILRRVAVTRELS
jgi:molecular chaperone GrpE (heat shock protein)